MSAIVSGSVSSTAVRVHTLWFSHRRTVAGVTVGTTTGAGGTSVGYTVVEKEIASFYSWSMPAVP